MKFFRSAFGRLQDKKRRTVYNGYLPGTPLPVLEVYTPRPRREPWTTSQRVLLVMVIVLALLIGGFGGSLGINWDYVVRHL